MLTLLDHLPEHAQLPDLKVTVHGLVRSIPFAHHAPATKLFLLIFDSATGELARFAPDLERRHASSSRFARFFALSCLVLLQSLELNRQAMTVPSRLVLDALAAAQLGAHDDVLQDLVQSVAGVDGAIGVGRTVMEDERILRLCLAVVPSRIALPLVKVIGASRAVRV